MTAIRLSVIGATYATYTGGSNYSLGDTFNCAGTSCFPQSAPPSNPGYGWYHNITMGTASLNTFATNIYGPYAGGGGYGMSKWLNYNTNPNIVISFDLTNSTTNGVNDCDLTVDVRLGDSNGSLTSVGSYIINYGDPTKSYNNVNTSIPVTFDSSTTYWGYTIWLVVTCTAQYTAGTVNCAVSSSDTDNVGPDTTRQIHGYPSFTNNAPTTNPAGCIVEFGSNVGNAQDPGGYYPIPINKRTTFTATFV